ncbi:MAG: hypothetical protein RLZZ522_607 [Verrucomicrobiota bacterium]
MSAKVSAATVFLEKSPALRRFSTVIDAPTASPTAPVWARDDAFPPAPAGFGWLDAKGRRHSSESLDALSAQVRDDPNGAVLLVWTPEFPAMRLPEEVGGLAAALAIARERWTGEELAATTSRVRWLAAIVGGLVGWQLVMGTLAAAHRIGGGGLAGWLRAGLVAVRDSAPVGMVLLLFVIFGFIPWYQARKRRSELGRWSEASTAALLPVLRFESWLMLQRAPLTRVFLWLMAVVWVAQMWTTAQSTHSLINALFATHSVAAAGLVKAAYLHGEWWRLLTAPLLHGNIVHFLMNMAALVYLGKRLEVFARWPHLPLVFLFAAAVGGEASVRFVAATSVGASGGLMGWLGFLIVFESLHGKLIPRSARRRLVAGVLLTGLIGLLGYRFIDNAAHLGGLLAGMAYAGIVFPKSTSPNRPGITVPDLMAGSAALAVIVAAAAYAVLRMAA